MGTDKNTLTQTQVLRKMERYCAYQDRCHWDVRGKLGGYVLTDQKRENVLCCLIENGFLDEERFARSFARGKHRIKSWGRLRIERELRARDIPSRLIARALSEIDMQDYSTSFEKLLLGKIKEAGGVGTRAQMAKVYRFMVSKGYESERVWEALSVKQGEKGKKP